MPPSDCRPRRPPGGRASAASRQVGCCRPGGNMTPLRANSSAIDGPPSCLKVEGSATAVADELRLGRQLFLADRPCPRGAGFPEPHRAHGASSPRWARSCRTTRGSGRGNRGEGSRLRAVVMSSLTTAHQPTLKGRAEPQSRPGSASSAAGWGRASRHAARSASSRRRRPRWLPSRPPPSPSRGLRSPSP
jgi:hypothetical protein